MTAYITPEPDTRLDQLLAQYDLAKAEEKKAAEAVKAITDGIKAELAKAAPEGETDIRVDSPALAQPLQLRATESWRLDSTRMKKEDPYLYASYAKPSLSWTLAKVAS